MAWRQHLDFHPVHFVTSSTDGSSSCSKKSQKRKDSLDGAEVRQFYEELIGNSSESANLPKEHDSNDVSKKKPNRKIRRKQKTVQEYDAVPVDSNSFLKAAQEGDVEFLEKALKVGVDIECDDQYGWTGLMCAAQSGQYKAVHFLLSSGANRETRDKTGKTAKDIAKSSKNSKIYHLIKNFQHESPKAERQQKQKVERVESHFCSVCNEQFSVSEATHISSTLHLFNMKLKTDPPTQYHIRPNNPGYRMMLRKGWNEEVGLGSEGQGQKYPVKTELKRDRVGLGKRKIEKRVTHFEAEDTKAIKTAKTIVRQERIATQSKKLLKSKERKEKKIEMKFRRDFYS